MEFYHLRSFVAVAQTGNLTQAAKRLYTTPPAISAHIKTLEEELSTPLFTRSSKGMTLTEKGKLLLAKAQITLDSAVDLVNLAANNQHEVIGTFRFASNVSIEQAKLIELASNLHENCPGISLDLHQQSTGKTLDEVRSHQLDGGYIFGDIPDDFIGITVRQQPITTLAPLNFDLNNTLTVSQLSQQPWIMMGEYCPFDNVLTEKLGSEMSSVLKSSDDGTRLALVKAGYGLSFVTVEEALIAEKDKQAQRLTMLDFSMPLHFVVAKNRADEPVIKALRQEINILWELQS